MPSSAQTNVAPAGSLDVNINAAEALLASAGGESVSDVSGGVASYFSVAELIPTLPAASLHDPLTAALAELGPEYVTGVSHTNPSLMASLPLTVNVTTWLYQPFASAPRDGVRVTAGAVASYSNRTTPTALLPAASAQLPLSSAELESGPL